ncbi:glycosyltransferase [Streptomyces sp. NPDC013161]|uniref:glycosyltransferase n=1 Tax=Streptomyces sp. NPDC013161 TaxID=3364862 RepID=UPI0036862AB3
MLLTTVGRRQPGVGKGDAVLALFVSHADVPPHTSVTVTHTGHGTVIASLAHGVPLVAPPNPAAGQPALAEQIERLGVGIALEGDTATPDHIAAAVHTPIRDDSYATPAGSLASSAHYQDRTAPQQCSNASRALPDPHGPHQRPPPALYLIRCNGTVPGKPTDTAQTSVREEWNPRFPGEEPLTVCPTCTDSASRPAI